MIKKNVVVKSILTIRNVIDNTERYTTIGQSNVDEYKALKMHT